MKINFQQAFRAFILLVFSGLLFKLNYSGEIAKFINPKYVKLSIVASFIFFILSIIQITRIRTIEKKYNHACDHNNHNDSQSCHHDHGTSPFTKKKLFAYVIIVFPLVTGYFLPAKFLDASIAEKKGGTAILANQQNTAETSVTQTEINKNTSQVVQDDNEMDSGLANQQAITQEEFQALNQKLEQSNHIKMSDD